jgi:hypothetical protein
VVRARFGGSGDDYQVLETEGPAGFLREAFLAAIGDGGVDRLRAGIWRGAGTVRVTRRWPVPTRAGKILPLHLARETDGRAPPVAADMTRGVGP